MQPQELKIRLYGDPCLRKKSSPVKEVGSAERMLIVSMIEIMHKVKGIGLAAPQVGINQKIFVADVGDGPFVFVNPKIIEKSGTVEMEEGCLSIPGVTISVKRPVEVVVKYINEHNEPVEKRFTELMARVIQHENDHLNGKLIVDYIGLIKKQKLRKQLKGLQKQAAKNL